MILRHHGRSAFLPIDRPRVIDGPGFTTGKRISRVGRRPHPHPPWHGYGNVCPETPHPGRQPHDRPLPLAEGRKTASGMWGTARLVEALEVKMPKRSILVIDDDPRHCELVAAILTTAGFDVLTAVDGLSGIDLARSVQPAAILLDMIMPGLDGITTCERLNRDPDLAGIPVVGVSGSADPTYASKAFRARAKFFLQKPFSRESLLRTVELAVQAAERSTRKPPDA